MVSCDEFRNSLYKNLQNEWYMLFDRQSKNIIWNENFKKNIHNISIYLEKELSKYWFNTFLHMYEFLKDIPEGKEDDLGYILDVLKNLDYNSLSYMENHNAWNCVDFVLKAKHDLFNSKNIETKIIWTVPNIERYTDNQRQFVTFRHVSLLFENDQDKALFEPSWKHYAPIILNPWYYSRWDNWCFRTIDHNDEEISQEIYMWSINKLDKRIFYNTAIDENECQLLTKKLTRMPRKLELISKYSQETPSYFVSFNPMNRWTVTTNVNWRIEHIEPKNMTLDENTKMSSVFEILDIKKYLHFTLEKYFKLNPLFWIK